MLCTDSTAQRVAEAGHPVPLLTYREDWILPNLHLIFYVSL